MIIKTQQLNEWGGLADLEFFGQEDDYIICETSEAPTFDYEELTEDYCDFKQLCCPNLWGNDKPTIAELKAIKEKIEYVGEKAFTVSTFGELDLLVQLKEAQVRADEQDLLLFEIITGGGIV